MLLVDHGMDWGRMICHDGSVVREVVLDQRIDRVDTIDSGVEQQEEEDGAVRNRSILSRIQILMTT